MIPTVSLPMGRPIVKHIAAVRDFELLCDVKERKRNPSDVP